MTGVMSRAFWLAVLTLFSVAMQAAVDNKGTEFFVAFNPNISVPAVEVHLTADAPTNVKVEWPVNSPTFSTTVAVNPGAVTIVSLNPNVSQSWVSGTVLNNVVHLTAPLEFVAYAINRATATSDAALALPVDTFNTKYIAAGYRPAFVAGQFTVVAAFDNTQVTITPSTALSPGRPAGVPFSVTLNRGQGIYFASAGVGLDLTGTIIEATRPVGVSNGDACTQVPNGTVACDHLFEVAQPVQSWGLEVPVANLPLRTAGSIYRILASENGTTVFRDGVSIGTINAGQFIETAPLPGNHVFAGSAPIFVVQYMTGQGSPGTSGTGDPSMGNMVPSQQYLRQYTFSTVGGSQFAQNFLTVIAANSDVGALMLDGAPIAAGSFTAVPGTSLSAAVVALGQGTHTSSSSQPHGITVEGYNSFDSYLYPGGALFQFINPQGDVNPPLCSVTVNPGPPSSASGTATDNRPSEDTNSNSVLDPGEDLNNNGQIDKDTGVFFVELVDAVNTQLTRTFTPGDPGVSFTVNLVNTGVSGSGKVRATDGAGNTCESPVTLNVNVTPRRCDVDADGDIDRNDIGLITAARNKPASGANDPRDADGNGTINVLDARKCTTQCTRTSCAAN